MHHHLDVNLVLADGVDVVLDVAHRGIQLFLIVVIDVIDHFLLVVAGHRGTTGAKMSGNDKQKESEKLTH